MQNISPEQIVAMLSRRANAQTDMGSKNRALKAITRASISLPVLTIAISERVRLEIEARRNADRNLAEYLSETVVSP